MTSPCKICSLQPCSCRKNKDGNSVKVKFMESPISHISTPERKHQHQRFRNFTYHSPLQSIRKPAAENMVSTPTRNCTLAISNPFELEIDSLNALSYSPSIFSMTRKTPDQKSPFWSIEQISALNPADIDETSQQEFLYRIDSEKERKAQEAIDRFFSKNTIAPSPWTPMKYTSFAPHLASTACQSQFEVQNASRQSCSDDDENNNDDDAVAKHVSTQTMLTIPPTLDLMSLLGHLYTYQTRLQKESLDSSFSRRKLFIDDYDDDSIDDRCHGAMCSPMSPEPNNNIPMKSASEDLKPYQWNSPFTPISDQFSSSPVTPRKFSLSINDTIPMCSPDISPVNALKTSQVTPKLRRGLEQLLVERNMFVAKISETNSSLKKDEFGILKNEQHTLRKALSSSSILMTSLSEVGQTSSENTQQDKVGENSENKTFSGISTGHRDTGYLTGSTDTTSSLTSQRLSSYQYYRTTPVAELLDDCAISQDPNSCNMSCDHDDSMMMSINHDCSVLAASANPLDFKNIPWEPHKFSTPTKSQTLLDN